MALLVAVAPLLLLLVLGVWISDGRPVFYRGARLGRGKRLFQMCKLRTLKKGAQEATGAELLGLRQDLTIRGGRFLRDTRLDELPQLWNIVRGDMSFVGPRPERPEVYAAKCAGIPGYEKRFDVRPGLIGISQLFTPHGTDKRYRTLIDNGSLRRGHSFLRDLGILAFTMWVMLSEVVRRSARLVIRCGSRLSGQRFEKRRRRRVEPRGALVHLGRRTAHLLDLNEETMRIECAHVECGSDTGLSADEAETELLLDIRVLGWSEAAHRTALCRGRVLQARPATGGTEFVLRYSPCSPRSEYMIHQYFLRSSLAAPRRSAVNGTALVHRRPASAAAPSPAPAALSIEPPAAVSVSEPEPVPLPAPANTLARVTSAP